MGESLGGVTLQNAELPLLLGLQKPEKWGLSENCSGRVCVGIWLRFGAQALKSEEMTFDWSFGVIGGKGRGQRKETKLIMG